MVIRGTSRDATPLAASRLEGYFVASAFMVVSASGHARCGAAAQLLIVKLQGHALIVLLAAIDALLHKQLLLNASARRRLRPRLQFRHLHRQFATINDRRLIYRS